MSEQKEIELVVVYPEKLEGKLKIIERCSKLADDELYMYRPEGNIELGAETEFRLKTKKMLDNEIKELKQEVGELSAEIVNLKEELKSRGIALYNSTIEVVK